METTETNDALLPPLAPVLSPLSEEEKRARQRLHERRAYHRKLHRLQVLRNQVNQLEAEYQSLLDAKQLEEACAFVSELPEFGDGSTNEKAGVSDEYVEILRVKELLHKHNEAMRKALAEYDRCEKRMQRLLDKEADEDMPSPSSQLMPSTSKRFSIVVPSLRMPITWKQCNEIGQRTFAEVQRFVESPDFITTGASVFGWRDKRQYEGEHIKFLLTKTMLSITATDFSQRAWDVLSSPSVLPSLYSASITVQFFLIQHVDEDNVILLRVYSTPDGTRQVKSLFLVSKFEIATGYAIIYRSLDPSLILPYEVPPGVQEQWTEYNSWIIYERTGDQQQHCLVSFGGKILKSLAIGSDALELLFIAVRSENLMLGTHLRLGS
ncbi:hypothetical protein Poli38472_013376 [Pythium oligandrum]|uniref:Uncharacterized protein n=1 Tax=Pythium oligandrum TaxID=41045 RepID=A0A8K1FFQ8_PYTOL|nr:hypothetical protein Poli38472_013376 [Pythium oligandrum]|eukprot:TMW57902.1 hypothetical protein Poli38472_013376 [Pythium oligandrum]